MNEIVAALMAQSEILSWTSYRVLLQVKDESARNWYAREACREAWSRLRIIMSLIWKRLSSTICMNFLCNLEGVMLS